MHQVKAGTPTMGGVALVGAGVVGYLIAHAGTHVAFSRPGILVVAVMLGSAAIGFVDDWIKVRHQRSLGLNKRAKFGAQVLVALGFALACEHWAGVNTHLSFTRYNSLGIDLGSVGWLVWAVFVVVGTANAVNLTDGLDGLASGSATFCFAILAIIGYWQFRHYSIYHVTLGARPGPHVHRPGRGLPGLPVVERGAGPDLHGGHRFAGHRRRPGRAVAADEPAAASAGDRRALRHRHPVGGDPGDQLPGLRPAGLPHGAPAPPFRAARAGPRRR